MTQGTAGIARTRRAGPGSASTATRRCPRCLPAVLGAVYAVVASLRIGQGGSRVPKSPSKAETGPTGYVNRDDDRYWTGGAVYINRDDPAIFVERRFGVGWTINLGHSIAWVVILAIAVLAFLPVLLRRLAHIEARPRAVVQMAHEASRRLAA